MVWEPDAKILNDLRTENEYAVPENHVVAQQIANTPAYLREYFRKSGGLMVKYCGFCGADIPLEKVEKERIKEAVEKACHGAGVPDYEGENHVSSTDKDGIETFLKGRKKTVRISTEEEFRGD